MHAGGIRFSETLVMIPWHHMQGTRAKILETRKTVPGLRVLDKWAVLIGGGVNHRIGLYDMVMIKNNHIAAAGSIEKAVRCTMVRHPIAWTLSASCSPACLESDAILKAVEEASQMLNAH